MYSLGYILESQICVAVLYLLYLTTMHKRIPHRAARLYLVAMIPLGLILPLISLPFLPAPEIMPMNIEMAFQEVEIAVAAPKAEPNYLLIGYLIGFTIMMLWIITGAVKLTMLLRKSRPERIEGLKVIFADQKISAFSVFNYIFVNMTLRRSELLPELLAHEECHIKLRHTVDLIVMSLTRAVLWFNPAVWHTGSLLRQVHEYQVDQQIIGQGYSAKNYINLLLLSEAGLSPELASPLSYSLTKNRLKMLANPTRASRTRLLLTIPAVALLLGAFSLTTRAAEAPQNKQTKTTVVTRTAVDQNQNETFVMAGNKSDSTQTFIVNMTQTKTNVDGKESSTFTVNVVPKSFEDGKKPLIILNGKVSDVTSSDIDPNTIESVTVLKDKSAIVKFGSAGQNGVVMIVQKGVKQDQKPDIKWVNNSTKKSYSFGLDEGKKPLILVNGKEYTEPMQNIQNSKIMSVSVLKDAAATELFGEKGKEGVIIIELKEDSEAAKPLEAVVQQKSEDQPLRVYKATAQSKENNPQDQKREKALDVAEVMPEFIGGAAAINEYLNKNIQYPIEAMKANEQGRVIVKFAIEADGSVERVQIARSVSPSLDAEAIRVVKSMPKWKPGKSDGKAVAVYFNLPVTFKFSVTATPAK